MTDNFDLNGLVPMLRSNVMDEDTEFIPLLSSEDEDQMNSEKVPEELSILPLRNTVLFPGVVIPITVGRDKSINLVKEAYKGDKIIGVVSQKNDSVEDPSVEDLNRIGTVAQIIFFVNKIFNNNRGWFSKPVHFFGSKKIVFQF